jgi:hypothetical protein
LKYGFDGSKYNAVKKMFKNSTTLPALSSANKIARLALVLAMAIHLTYSGTRRPLAELPVLQNKAARFAMPLTQFPTFELATPPACAEDAFSSDALMELHMSQLEAMATNGTQFEMMQNVIFPPSSHRPGGFPSRRSRRRCSSAPRS